MYKYKFIIKIPLVSGRSTLLIGPRMVPGHAGPRAKWDVINVKLVKILNQLLQKRRLGKPMGQGALITDMKITQNGHISDDSGYF